MGERDTFEDFKRKNKILTIGIIVLGLTLIAVVILIVVLQSTILVLEEVIIKEGQVIDAALGKITGLEADVAKLKNDMGSMALQAANDQKEIKALKHSRSEFTTIAAWLIAIRDECLNYCGSKFVPGVLKGLKKFEALISQLAKAGAL